MGYPVVHFELHGRDAGRLNGFYADVFGWEIDADNPMNYGRVDTKSGTGIAGGITASDIAPAVLVYIQVPDAQAALGKVQAAGGKVVMPVKVIPGAVTMAIFEDVEGNKVGLVNAETPGSE
ncbi:MAG: VOC family protein [Alphaproteobacteria bacterium]